MIMTVSLGDSFFFGWITPKWCSYPVEPCHPTMHCWGITHGYVEKKGVEYCKNCECLKED